MKDALSLCSLALSSNPTTPTASLVKVDQGMMSAYGGLSVFKFQSPKKSAQPSIPALCPTSSARNGSGQPIR